TAFHFVGYGLTFGLTSAFVTWFTAVAGSGVGTRRVEESVNGAFFRCTDVALICERCNLPHLRQLFHPYVYPTLHCAS
ncbi:hypothetical protein BD410DRAFT_789409, partial [Rickenella mellea]